MGNDLKEIDTLCKDLISFYESRGAKIILLSEYGICNVKESIPINRILRNEGLLNVRKERNYELLDPGASKAFAERMSKLCPKTALKLGENGYARASLKFSAEEHLKRLEHLYTNLIGA